MGEAFNGFLVFAVFWGLLLLFLNRTGAGISSLAWLLAPSILLGMGGALVEYIQQVIVAHRAIPTWRQLPIIDFIEEHLGQQPARLAYPFQGGWQAIDYLLGEVFAGGWRRAANWFARVGIVLSLAEAIDNNYVKYLLWVLYYTLAVLVGVYLVVISAGIAVFLAANLLLLFLWLVIFAAIVAALLVWNLVYNNINRIFVRCNACHETMLMPVYICPTCAARHTRLWPSAYGIFDHTCTCGQQLPTMDFLGRGELNRVCAKCTRPMNKAIGRQINVHIPVIGGPSTGKTNFIFQATRQFLEEYAPPRRIKVNFPDEEHRRNYEADKRLVNSGQVLNKTTEITPQAYNLSINRPHDRIGRIAYIYDAAGEAYTSEANTLLQKPYYNYVQSLIFIIDPFSIELFCKRYEKDIARLASSVRPSVESAQSAYERMMAVLESAAGMHGGQRYEQPFALVISKTDALRLEHEIGRPAAQRYMRIHPTVRSETDAIDILVEEFLTHYQMGNLVRDVKKRFKKVRFFSCSALGRMPGPDQHAEFKPFGVLDPFLWIMSQAGVIDITRERVKAVDEADLRTAASKGSVFQRALYYMFDSLVPHPKSRSVKICPRCGKEIPGWAPTHLPCLLSRTKYLMLFLLFLFLTILSFLMALPELYNAFLAISGG